MTNLGIVTEGTRPPTLPDDLWQDVFPLLRDNIGVGKHLKVKQVADELGVSSPSVSAWINNKGRPNYYNLLQVLRIIGQRPESGANELAARIAGKFTVTDRGTLEAADAAAKQLTEVDGVPATEAWSVMRELVGTGAEALYERAKAILGERALRERHASRVEEMMHGAAPVGRIKTR